MSFTTFPGELKPPTGLSAVSRPGETFDELRVEPGARIVINRPQLDHDPDRPVLLIFLRCPTEATIEQAIGKEIQPGDDLAVRDPAHRKFRTPFLA